MKNAIPKTIINAINACEAGSYTKEQLKIVQLMRAAPYLLKACKEAKKFIMDQNKGKCLSCILEAISKAEGE